MFLCSFPVLCSMQQQKRTERHFMAQKISNPSAVLGLSNALVSGEVVGGSASMINS